MGEGAANLACEMSERRGESGGRADKFCAVCGRRVEWRKKWERDWASVRACSDRCKRTRLDETDARLEEGVRSLCAARGRSRTVCPSEVARIVGGKDEAAWRALMERARWAVNRLCAAGEAEMTQGGRVVAWSAARGAVRVRLR